MQEAKYSTYEVRVRAVQAVLEGMTVTQVAQAYQIDRTTLHRWLTRYQKSGSTEGLARHSGSGRPRKLHEVNLEQWRAMILQPASTFGFETDFWTAKWVHQVVTEQFGVSVGSRTIIHRLQEAGLSYQKPVVSPSGCQPNASGTAAVGIVSYLGIAAILPMPTHDRPSPPPSLPSAAGIASSE